MNDDVQRLVGDIHRVACPMVLAITGGGASAAAALLGVPGASKSILEVIVPYHQQALWEFVGRQPEQSCSAETAQLMAERAWARAQHLASGQMTVGLGCTASLASDRPKRGDHRAFIAVEDGRGIEHHALTFIKGARDRQGEETVLCSVLLNVLAATAGLTERLATGLLPAETLAEEPRSIRDALVRCLSGELPAACFEPDGRVHAGADQPRALLSGSFNPVHAGHWRLAEAAERRLQVPVGFEMSAVNVDKPPLSVAEVHRRLAQFADGAVVWVTRAPTFIEKSRLFPNCVFVVGIDTAVRIVDPRYYGNDVAAMLAAVQSVGAAGCRFLVAGRCDSQGRFLDLSSCGLPPLCRDLFEQIPETAFRVDVCSTELRVNAGGV
jgi:hypothetical protein